MMSLSVLCCYSEISKTGYLYSKRVVWLVILVASGSKECGINVLLRASWLYLILISWKQIGHRCMQKGAKYVGWDHFVTIHSHEN